MQTLIHADIFFFITTIAVILISLVTVIILVYIVFILRDVRDLTRIIKREGTEITEDVHAFREEIKDGLKHSMRSHQSTIAAFLNLIANFFSRRRSSNYKK